MLRTEIEGRPMVGKGADVVRAANSVAGIVRCNSALVGECLELLESLHIMLVPILAPDSRSDDKPTKCSEPECGIPLVDAMRRESRDLGVLRDNLMIIRDQLALGEF